MSDSVSDMHAQSTPDKSAPHTCLLHVCTSCRPSGAPREPQDTRAGYILYQQLRKAINDSPLKNKVEIHPAECLSVCPRPCGIALSSPGSWTYLYGDQQPNETVYDIIECLSLYIESPDGFMPRRQRPRTLRGSILGRVPPTKGER